MKSESATNGFGDELKELRRGFHKYPESGWLEYRTSAKRADYLTITRL
tara:strand:+ start:2478 stop:2621 length:144 start_codon:yes stop_codon:yes gene_type:complete